eukprot:1633750-Pleurochrysis_carterae.AAC.1
MRRTSDRPAGTAVLSISSQLPFSAWLAISARSAAVHPARSSRKACLRVFGSALDVWATKAHPVLCTCTSEFDVTSRTVRRAVGVRLRKG